MELKYGDHTINTTKLPATSIDALLRRGISHFLGNEQASKVAAWVESQNTERTKTGVDPVSDVEKATYKADCQKKAVEALVAGTVGVHTPRGPKATPLDAIVRQLAEKEVKDILGHNKLKMPKGDEAVSFPDGTKLTRVELIDRRIAKHGERLVKEAKAELARRDREAQKAGGVEALL